MSSNEGVFRVRDYTPADFPHLCDLDRLCFSEPIAYTPQEIALGLRQQGAFALVADAQSQVVAFILVSQRRSVGHIITIDVRPEYRAKGIGGELMRLAEERMQQRGATRIVLEVATNNENAMQFYQARGYIVRRLLTGYYADQSDAYLMEKTLE